MQENEGIPSPDEMRSIINSIESLRDRAFVTILYLTAARVSEVCGRSEKFIVRTEKHNARVKQKYCYSYKIKGSGNHHVYKEPDEDVGLTRSSFQVLQKGERQILLIKLKNRKHKKRKFKEIPLPENRDRDLIEIIFRYLKEFRCRLCRPEAPKCNNCLTAPLFDFGIRRARQIVTETTGWNPHWLRHIRLSHLVVYSDFTSPLLQQYAGWSSISPASHYMELKWSDILQKL